MKKRLLLTLGGLLVLGLGAVSQVSAAGYVASGGKDEKTLVAKEHTIDGSAYLAGTTVLVDGTIKGDLYCAGTTVVISGTVEGDVLCGGSDVTIGGTVKGDVRAAGANVIVKGAVAGNATLAGSNVTIVSGAQIGGDVTGGSSSLTIDGTVGRDMTLGAETFLLNGTITRDVNAALSVATFGANASVGGNLNYTGQNEVQIPQGVVHGNVAFTQQEKSKGSSAVNPLTWGAWFVALLVVLAVLMTLVMPKYVHEASTASPQSALIAFLAGLAVLILTPIAAVVLMTSVIGILAGLVLLVVWSLVMLLASVFSAYYIGTLVLRKRARNAIVVAAIGALILGVVLLIPVLNAFVAIVSLCVGIGMQVMYLRHQFSKHPYRITA